MKIIKSTLTFLLLVSVFSLATLSAQNNKRVLLEEFTNASCGPCADQNPGFQILLNANTTKVVPIKWQTSWPGFDPFYDHNSEENGERTGYYPDVSGVPSVITNGTSLGSPSGVNQTGIDNLYNTMTPISMVINHSFNSEFDMIDVNLTITNDGAEPFSLGAGKVHVILLEDEVVFPSAPGSNGEEDFFQIAIKMLTGMTGQDLPTLGIGESHTVTLSQAIPRYTYDVRELRVAAFVQDDTNKSVHQSTISDLDPVAIAAPYKNLEIASTTEEPTGLCGATVTPTISVTNIGEVDVTEFNVSYLVSGGTTATENWTGTLAVGASEAFVFPEVVLTELNTTVSYSVEIVGGGDLSPVSNYVGSPIYNSISETPTGSGYAEDNEEYADNDFPAIAAIKTPHADNFVIYSQDVSPNITEPIGGFGTSEKSILVNFYDWQFGIATMIYDKISLVGASGTTLSFDRAYAQYQAENDRLAVSVSTNCGDSWTEVYSKQGNSLETTAATQGFFVPAADEWVVDFIDLSAYDGAEEMIVRFRVTSNYGNNLYLDNINLYSAVNNQNLHSLNGINVEVTPNPAVNNARINIDLDRALEMDIAIYDMSGKLVRNLAQGQDFVEGTSTIAWDLRSNEGAAVANGLYMVRIMSAEGQVTSKVMIAK